MRWLLPAIQLTIFLIATGTGCPYVEEWRRRHETPDASQPGIEFQPDWIDAPFSPQERIATVLNLPVVLAAAAIAPAATPDPDSGYQSDLTFHALELILIPPFWYTVGRILDRRRIPKTPHRPTPNNTPSPRK